MNKLPFTRKHQEDSGKTSYTLKENICNIYIHIFKNISTKNVYRTPINQLEKQVNRKMGKRHKQPFSRREKKHGQ